MTAPQRSRRRTIAGLILAIFVAPVVTALCFEIPVFLTLGKPIESLSDAIGGASMFLLFAFFFGGLLAAVPVLIFGSIVIMVARDTGTRSPLFYATAGALAGLFMAWVDTKRTSSAFDMLEAVPFVVGGCSCALAYWAIAER